MDFRGQARAHRGGGSKPGFLEAWAHGAARLEDPRSEVLVFVGAGLPANAGALQWMIRRAFADALQPEPEIAPGL